MSEVRKDDEMAGVELDDDDVSPASAGSVTNFAPSESSNPVQYDGYRTVCGRYQGLLPAGGRRFARLVTSSLTHDPALLSPVGFDGHSQHALDVVVQIGMRCPSGLVWRSVDPNAAFIGSNH